MTWKKKTWEIKLQGIGFVRLNQRWAISASHFRPGLIVRCMCGFLAHSDVWGAAGNGVNIRIQVMIIFYSNVFCSFKERSLFSYKLWFGSWGKVIFTCKCIWVKMSRGDEPAAKETPAAFSSKTSETSLREATVSWRRKCRNLRCFFACIPWMYFCFCGALEEVFYFLGIQWLRIHLPMQGTWVLSLVWEDSTCHGATKLIGHSYWAHTPQLPKPAWSRRSALQQERPWQWETHTPQAERSPAGRN